MQYDPHAVEKKWQRLWAAKKVFKAPDHPPANKSKCYVLGMFPYPSGKLHMGHVRNYTIPDVLARFKAMQGHTVLHPIGWDSFGMPAENAAIAKGVSPRTWTLQNIKVMKKQLQAMGYSYDWSREIATSKPDYYRFNQWLFLKFYEKGLIYKATADANWCPKCATVLANEQVVNGLCWRCKSHVTIKALDQWFVKISQYTDELLRDLGKLKGNWPEEVLTMQRNWIGKSWGAQIDFPLADNPQKKLTVFTTRPDTLYGATFMVVSPDHPELGSLIAASERTGVMEYVEQAKRLKLQKAFAEKEKTGIFLGTYATNPINQEKIPIWCASYVLASYGTGAIMCVPAHDSRDFEFAKTYNLPIRQVIASNAEEGTELKKAYEGDGPLINSGELNGLACAQAKTQVTQKLAALGLGQEKTTYRLRDWLISRQRAWGTPIPIIYCIHCGTQPVPYEKLPVKLPATIPITGHGESPLKRVKAFLWTKCPQCKKKAQRETDTMDTFVDSSWYYARYLDHKNTALPFSKEKAAAWLPVDIYVGGIEHACMHLIYARFFHKALRDLGLLDGDEPFKRLYNQGMITLGGSAMSKSKGNVVDPETITKKYGADTLRAFMMFIAPPRQSAEWTEGGVEGIWRFLTRLWKVTDQIKSLSGKAQVNEEQTGRDLLKKAHHTIQAVTQDLENAALNTPISKCMELLNTLEDYPGLGDPTSAEVLKILLVLINPYTPHIASELLQSLGFDPLKIAWPQADPQYLTRETMKIAIQINGKLRDLIELGKEQAMNQTVVETHVRANPKVEKHLENATLIKVIFVPGKIINFVVRENAKN